MGRNEGLRTITTREAPPTEKNENKQLFIAKANGNCRKGRDESRSERKRAICTINSVPGMYDISWTFPGYERLCAVLLLCWVSCSGSE